MDKLKTVVSSDSIQNGRKYQEDRSSVDKFTIHGNKYLLLTVCDGHGGHKASDFCSVMFPKTLKSFLKSNIDEASALGHAVRDIVDAYDLKTTGHVLRKLSSDQISNERKNLTTAPKETDGSTLNALLLNLTQRKGWAANLGDSRSAWFIDDVVNQTKDHTPTKDLILSAPVKQDGNHSRVYCSKVSLDVYGTIGDNHPGFWGKLLRQPEITPFNFDSHPFRGIVASDGFWNVHKARPKETERLLRSKGLYQLSDFAKVLVRFSKPHTSDNITVLTVSIDSK